MFASSLTNELYEDFLESYQLDKKQVSEGAFVYVDSDSSEIKLITGMALSGSSDDLLAYFMDSSGDIEVLSSVD